MFYVFSFGLLRLQFLWKGQKAVMHLLDSYLTEIGNLILFNSVRTLSETIIVGK